MKPRWGSPFRLASLDEGWADAPRGAGIYVIRGNRELPRVGATDPAGIIYIGQSKRLRSRLWAFWVADHGASGLLWENPKQAALLLGKHHLTRPQVGQELGRLSARVATPVETGDLDVAERATLYAYIERFGEMPPLNNARPKRWGRAPSKEWTRWGCGGLSI